MNPQILSNIMKFLERVSPAGMESYAWVEAHQACMSELQKQKGTVDANPSA